MIKVALVLYYALFAFVLLYAAWFFITGVIGIILKNKNKFKRSESKIKFAILIPARNEELVIENLIKSLKKQNYPNDKFEIYTVVNNCTDNTSNIAKNAGSKIIECTAPTKTKGDVLKIAFDKLKDDKDIDAYIVFDADNIVHPEFLNKMNDCYNSGYRVAEGFRDAKNPDDNWISGSYAIFYLVQNVFFNRARMSIGGSSSINGTGFMVDKKMIDEEGFNTYTLTEDVEYTGQCALKGEKIAFVEEAITYDEYPTSNKVSWIQRKRWSSGILQCMSLYSIKLFIKFIKTGKISALDMSLTYLGPIMQILVFLLSIITIVFRATGIELNNTLAFIYQTDILTLLVSYLFGLLIEMFVLIYKHKKIFKVWKGLLLFPLFLIIWIPINICCLIKKETSWKVIKHDRNIDYSKVVINK